MLLYPPFLLNLYKILSWNPKYLIHLSTPHQPKIIAPALLPGLYHHAGVLHRQVDDPPAAQVGQDAVAGVGYLRAVGELQIQGGLLEGEVYGQSGADLVAFSSVLLDFLNGSLGVADDNGGNLRSGLGFFFLPGSLRKQGTDSISSHAEDQDDQNEDCFPGSYGQSGRAVYVSFFSLFYFP